MSHLSGCVALCNKMRCPTQWPHSVSVSAAPVTILTATCMVNTDSVLEDQPVYSWAKFDRFLNVVLKWVLCMRVSAQGAEVLILTINIEANKLTDVSTAGVTSFASLVFSYRNVKTNKQTKQNTRRPYTHVHSHLHARVHVHMHARARAHTHTHTHTHTHNLPAQRDSATVNWWLLHVSFKPAKDKVTLQNEHFIIRPKVEVESIFDLELYC